MIKRNTDEDSLKAYCDIKNSLDTARKEGITEGMAKGMAKGMAEGITEGITEGMAKEKAKIAKKLLEIGMPLESIIQVTGLTENEINNLQ